MTSAVLTRVIRLQREQIAQLKAFGYSSVQVGWHYVKQGYGILIVDSVQKRLMFSGRAKILLRANGYACWMVAWKNIRLAP